MSDLHIEYKESKRKSDYSLNYGYYFLKEGISPLFSRRGETEVKEQMYKLNGKNKNKVAFFSTIFCIILLIFNNNYTIIDKSTSRRPNRQERRKG